MTLTHMQLCRLSRPFFLIILTKVDTVTNAHLYHTSEEVKHFMISQGRGYHRHIINPPKQALNHLCTEVA